MLIEVVEDGYEDQDEFLDEVGKIQSVEVTKISLYALTDDLSLK